MSILNRQVFRSFNCYLSHYLQKQERNWINWRDFAGRQNATEKLAVLYPHLEERTEAPTGGVRPNRRPRR
jgi:hypothetical protein